MRNEEGKLKMGFQIFFLRVCVVIFNCFYFLCWSGDMEDDMVEVVEIKSYKKGTRRTRFFLFFFWLSFFWCVC
jgi:hypothetical protein